MRCIAIFCLALCCTTYALAQTPHVLNTREYTHQVKTSPDKRLVEIVKAIPGIQLDIRYATTDNFMHRIMYKQARAFARAPVVDALKQIQAELKLKGLGLKIYDAYRPYAVTVDFYNMAKDTNFVASPKYGSKHNRGCAIDLSIIELETGKEINMPTPFDSFSPIAAIDYLDLPAEQLKNRELLETVMIAHGFATLRTEWWHFDFIGYQGFELLDVPFAKL